ncbi:hypothetical protein [Aquabacterium sp.]|uniref:hypothetical protein n=1 Tax=Aquabacterium sp. TaxID=1872578 RepID=UPI0025BD3DB7|nr:hypothetical protein [Aquabacterium sp.]
MPHPHPPQTELALDHTPALEPAMRSLFETRWARWHRLPFDEAMKDPITRRLLCLAVQHLPSQVTPRRPRSARR